MVSHSEAQSSGYPDGGKHTWEIDIAKDFECLSTSKCYLVDDVFHHHCPHCRLGKPCKRIERTLQRVGRNSAHCTRKEEREGVVDGSAF